MKCRSNGTGRRRRWISYLMIIVLLVLMIPAVPSEASARSTAISQYKKLLSKKRISVLPQGKKVETYDYRYVPYWSSKASNVKFFLCYIDGDNVPELVLSDYYYGYGVWTYKNGSFRCLMWGDIYDKPIGYYAQKSVVRINGYSEGTIFYREYYKVQVGKKKQKIQYEEYNNAPEGQVLLDRRIKSGNSYKKVSNSVYYKNLKKNTGGKSMKRIYLHNNTAANRKKYLK